MGGYGSGRRPGKQKQDFIPRVSLSLLQRNGYLNDGTVSALKWYRRKRCLGTVKITAYTDELFFECQLTQLRKTPITQRVQLQYTSCHLGGNRPWMLCPGCRRRVMFLYALTTYFRCRHCCRLTYASRNEGQIDTLLRRVRHARRKIGAGDDLTQPIPLKPKWKHHLKHKQRTYRAMQKQMDLLALLEKKVQRTDYNDT